jgi:hypothetical protein
VAAEKLGPCVRPRRDAGDATALWVTFDTENGPVERRALTPYFLVSNNTNWMKGLYCACCRPVTRPAACALAFFLKMYTIACIHIMYICKVNYANIVKYILQ